MDFHPSISTGSLVLSLRCPNPVTGRRVHGNSDLSPKNGEQMATGVKPRKPLLATLLPFDQGGPFGHDLERTSHGAGTLERKPRRRSRRSWNLFSINSLN